MKRFICFILAFAIIVLSIPFCSFASSELIRLDISLSGQLDYSINSFDLKGNIPQYYYQHNDFSRVYSSNSTLNELQKQVYNNVVNAEIGNLTIPMSFDYGEFPVEYFTQEFFNDIMYTIAIDNPEIFYFAAYSIPSAYVYSGSEYIAAFDYNVVMFSNATYIEGELSSRYDDMMSVVENAPVNTSNRYSFVKSVHDFLCNNAYYPDLNSSDYTGNCHDAYGCLVEGKTVCQGYADAFKLFCNEYKIPCVFLSGTSDGVNHAWNAVQMDDGRWYLIDVTWDDQTDSYGIFYDFFLVGLNSTDTYFGKNAFNVSHVSDGNLYLPVLDYATDKYTQTNHNTAFEATYNSLAIDEGKYLVRSYFDITDTYVYYNGMYVETNSLTTNDAFKVPSGTDGAEENWTLVVLGDCNGDGACDALDYSYAVNKSFSQTGDNDAYALATDIDLDGYLDSIDVSMIYLLINGLATEIDIE